MVKMLGFVGCGNMAQAMLKGILSKGLYAKEDILVSRRNEEALQNIQKEFGVNVTTDNAEVAKQADVLILAVKPFQFETVISEIRNEVSENTRPDDCEYRKIIWKDYQISKKYAKYAGIGA